MNTKRVFWRVGAILSAVLLLGGYVYERAGGHLLEKVGLSLSAPPPGQGDMLSGSKSDVLLNPGEQPVVGGSKSAMVLDNKDLIILSGSKSASPVFAPPSLEKYTQPTTPPEPQSEPVQVVPVNPSTKLLPGSKALIIADPTPAPAPNQLPPQLLPGSKGGVLPPPGNAAPPVQEPQR